MCVAPAAAHAEAFGAGGAQQDQAAVEGSSPGHVAEGPRATSEGITQLHHCGGKSCSTGAQVQLANIRVLQTAPVL